MSKNYLKLCLYSEELYDLTSNKKMFEDFIISFKIPYTLKTYNSVKLFSEKLLECHDKLNKDYREEKFRKSKEMLIN